jgi:hypothetical protein
MNQLPKRRHRQLYETYINYLVPWPLNEVVVTEPDKADGKHVRIHGEDRRKSRFASGTTKLGLALMLSPAATSAPRSRTYKATVVL